jgi:hypothetical protein
VVNTEVCVEAVVIVIRATPTIAMGMGNVTVARTTVKVTATATRTVTVARTTVKVTAMAMRTVTVAEETGLKPPYGKLTLETCALPEAFLL